MLGLCSSLAFFAAASAAADVASLRAANCLSYNDVGVEFCQHLYWYSKISHFSLFCPLLLKLVWLKWQNSDTVRSLLAKAAPSILVLSGGCEVSVSLNSEGYSCPIWVSRAIPASWSRSFRAEGESWPPHTLHTKSTKLFPRVGEEVRGETRGNQWPFLSRGGRGITQSTN